MNTEHDATKPHELLALAETIERDGLESPDFCLSLSRLLLRCTQDVCNSIMHDIVLARRLGMSTRDLAAGLRERARELLVVAA